MDIRDIQLRLKAWMNEYDRDVNDVASALDVSVERIQSFRAMKAGAHVLTGKILDLVTDKGQQVAHQPKELPENSVSIRVSAARILYAFKTERRITWTAVANILNSVEHKSWSRRFSAAGISSAIAPSSKASTFFFRDVITAIRACDAHADDTSHDGLDAIAITDPVPAEEPDKLDALIRSEALTMLEHELGGISIDDLKPLRRQIEMLAVARRNNVSARVVIEPVEISQ